MPVIQAKNFKANLPTFICTDVYNRNVRALKAGKRRIMNEGGASSSKTYSILQMLILQAMSTKRPLLISIVSESLPHLRLGAIRDFFNILGESQDANPKWSKTLFTYTFSDISRIEFFGADDEGKARGPRRQILYINEANNVPWETAKMLDMRTEVCTICDWNPVSEFWAHWYLDSDGKQIPGWAHWHEDEKGKRVADDPTSEYIHSTYKDAIDVIPKSVVETLESYRDKDPNTWSVYGLGQMGRIEGRVYGAFDKVDQLPKGSYFYGLDFGFSNDPAVLTRHVVIGDALYSQEVIYERGLTNDVLCRKMDLAGVDHTAPIYADAAEPKSIEEIKQKGFNIRPTEKGKGSVDFGIQKVNQYRQFWTKDSVHCIDEQRNFCYIKDPATGAFTDKTTHQFSHGMDSRRYAIAGKRFSTWSNTPISSLHWR